MRDAETRLRQMERILEISRELTATVSLERLLHKIMAAAVELTDCEAAGILLLDEPSGELRFMVATNFVDGLANVPVPIDASIAGASFSSGEPVIVPDVHVDPRFYPMVQPVTGLKARSLLAVPLQFQERRIGVLEVVNKRARDDEFDQEDVETLSVLAAQATVAIEGARLYSQLEEYSQTLEEKVAERTHELQQNVARLQTEIAERKRVEEVLRRRMDEMIALHAVAVVGTQATGLGELIDEVTQILGQIPYDDHQLGVGMVDEAANVLHIHFPPWNGHGIVERQIPLGQGIVGRVVATGKLQRVPDVACEPVYPPVAPETRSALCVPLKVGDCVIGVINAESRQLDAFSEADERLMTTIAGELSIIIEKLRLLDEVQQLAITDPLTGLFNRRHFFELAEREFARARRYQHPLAVLMLDLDHFKNVNDTYGHAVGDQVLREVGARCLADLRDVDVLGRYGGEEFTVVLPETDPADARQLADRLCQRIAQAVVQAGPSAVAITTSIGIASLDDECADLDVLLQRADQALYAAKRAGRNCVRVWPC